jgi:hypothetical protein
MSKESQAASQATKPTPSRSAAGDPWRRFGRGMLPLGFGGLTRCGKDYFEMGTNSWNGSAYTQADRREDRP